MTIEIKPHTIYVLIGPSHCGKSWFAADMAAKTSAKVHIVSSDNCRRELLGDMSIDKMSPEMMPVSRQAFNLLTTKVDLLTQFPVNAEVVVVDSTGLDDKFQAQIVEIANKNNYNYEAVVFDYNSNEDYYTSCMSDFQKTVTQKHVRRLKKETLRGLNRNFKEIHRIRRRGDFEFTTSSNFDLLWSCNFPSGDYILFSDSHGCYDEVYEGLKPHLDSDKTIINMGDYIDKGPQSDKMIYFLESNPQIINLCGNHEHYCYLRLMNKLDGENDQHFNSLPLLFSDPQLAGIFTELYEHSLPFINLNNKFIITHAPCPQEFLGKVGPKNERAQRNWRYTGFDSKEEVFRQLKEMMRGRPSIAPTQVFGHVSFDRVIKEKTYISIDTGVVSGNNLTILELSV